MIDRFINICYRGFFVLASLLFIVALWDKLLGLFALRLSWVPFDPGRLLQISALLMVFVIALLLRQIREAMSKKG